MFAGDEEQQHKKMERLVAVQRVSLAGDSRNAKQKRVERHCSVPKRDLLVFLQRTRTKAAGKDIFSVRIF